MLPNTTICQLHSEEHLRSCVCLLRSAFETVAVDFGITEESAPTNAAFTTLENLQRHVQQGMAFYGIYCDSLLVGCVAIKKSKGNKLVYYIERLAVAPGKRHFGLGGQLLMFAVGTIRKGAGRTASIGVMDNNDRLCST